MLDARGGRDDRYGLYGIYKTSKKTEEMSREESVQHFLDLIKKSRRGKFKVYIGMIAGVGKSSGIVPPRSAMVCRTFFPTSKCV